jgi:hypothetical protein
MQDDEMKHARNQFFEGEGPQPFPSRPVGSGNIKKTTSLTAGDMMNRMDPRLRRLVVRACHNSYAAAKVLGLFEEFVVASFVSGNRKKSESLVKTILEGWWHDLLIECPSVSQRKDNSRYTAQFFFDPTSSTGGFHRLLLQAICQFHGLHTISRMVRNISIGDNTEARALIITGNIEKVKYRLLEHLEGKEEDLIVASTCKPDWIVV